ncbi:MAG: hypothetical protein Roseis2KO_40680 [Roseivirga sp.]
MIETDGKQPKSTRLLAETGRYSLLALYEDVYLIEKSTGHELWRTSMFGDPDCGIIAANNQWAVAGGQDLIIWFNQELSILGDVDLQWIHDLRQTGDKQIEVLIDPWSEKSAIWKFELDNSQKTKIRDFNDYKERPFKEVVTW